ncbi:hypothetical protein [Enterobacter ludwigii]|jgi:hypothetical protein
MPVLTSPFYIPDKTLLLLKDKIGPETLNALNEFAADLKKIDNIPDALSESFHGRPEVLTKMFYDAYKDLSVSFTTLLDNICNDRYEKVKGDIIQLSGHSNAFLDDFGCVYEKTVRKNIRSVMLALNGSVTGPEL